MKPCNVPHPDIFVIAHGYNRAVHCIRDLNHPGHHLAAPFGKVVTWIEPERTRGATKLDGDDAPVVSPSDPRAARPSWWRRLLAWVSRIGK